MFRVWKTASPCAVLPAPRCARRSGVVCGVGRATPSGFTGVGNGATFRRDKVLIVDAYEVTASPNAHQ